MLNRRAIIIFLSFALVLAGCASTKTLDRSTDRGSESKYDAEVEEVPIRGSRVMVYMYATFKASITGELLAIDDDQIWVLSGRKIKGIPRSSVKRVSLRLYKSSEAGAVAAWATIGMLSTFSHGWFSVLTGTVWIIGGMIMTIQADTINRIQVLPNGFDMLYQYARFPQGIQSIELSSVTK